MPQEHAPQDFEQPLVAVDVVIFTLMPGLDGCDRLNVLLIKRDAPPFAGRWSIPGGFLLRDEALNVAAGRVLQEKTGLDHVYLEQLYSFGGLHRDPRGRVITVAYYALVRQHDLSRLPPTSWHVRWFTLSDVPVELAFDHDEIVQTALQRLRNKVSYRPVAFQFLPRLFSMAQLRHVYEVILERKLDPGNFIHKALASGVVEATDQWLSGNRHRPPRLYRFTGVEDADVSLTMLEGRTK